MSIIEEIGGNILMLQMSEFSDARGNFIKLFDNRIASIQPYDQKQLNYVVNKNKFTGRGLHYQKGSFAESKIFRVLKGSVRVIAFNVEFKSAVYKQSFSAVLNKPDLALWVPRGYATGYYTLEDNTDVIYSSDNDYHPEAESGLRWNDPVLRFSDLIYSNLILSDKDKSWPDFK